ncbi:hypothetical protein KP509_17G024300 [Ceratopteris richardii]|uniref:Uncharacterized protein n=1 Tax=Ceratopteris richardii TaxID=49495 RepID=A0A8T2SWQ7_CERRI|nr:hypothetical protein KP509_17G024300 [Ceratopteris richardii]
MPEKGGGRGVWGRRGRGGGRKAGWVSDACGGWRRGSKWRRGGVGGCGGWMAEAEGGWRRLRRAEGRREAEMWRWSGGKRAAERRVGAGSDGRRSGRRRTTERERRRVAGGGWGGGWVGWRKGCWRGGGRGDGGVWRRVVGWGV